VAPERRGRLLGTRLVLEAGLRLRDAGVRRLGVRAPTGADSFFDRLGFTATAGGMPGPPPPGSGPTTALGRELRAPGPPGQP
jgi:predicted N-acetyltransferase YhbS